MLLNNYDEFKNKIESVRDFKDTRGWYAHIQPRSES